MTAPRDLADPARWPAVSVLGRGAALFGVWIAMAGTGAAELAIGVPAAALASWASLHLLPPGMTGLAPWPLFRLALRLPGQSLLTGIEVARLALGPGKPDRSGLVSCQLDLPPGVAREVFLSLSSLQPGTLPIEERANGTMRLHAIDAGDGAAEAFTQEQRRFAPALRAPAGGAPNG